MVEAFTTDATGYAAMARMVIRYLEAIAGV